MSTLHLRQRLVYIAKDDVGKIESSRNQGAAMKRYWPATSYPEGYANRSRIAPPLSATGSGSGLKIQRFYPLSE